MISARSKAKGGQCSLLTGIDSSSSHGLNAFDRIYRISFLLEKRSETAYSCYADCPHFVVCQNPTYSVCSFLYSCWFHPMIYVASMSDLACAQVTLRLLPSRYSNYQCSSFQSLAHGSKNNQVLSWSLTHLLNVYLLVLDFD